MDISWLELTFRLFLAAILGGVIGYQREAAERPAGFRTHILVSIGSTLIMLISLHFSGLEKADPSRIAAGAITGIGFLGAGTIIRQGNIVIGLTTAASLWTTAAIGFAIGSGYYTGALVATVLTLIVLVFFKKFEKKMIKHSHRQLTVITKDSPGKLNKLRSSLGPLNAVLSLTEIEHLPEGKIAFRVMIEIPANVDPETILSALADNKEFACVRWEE
jgi:putative Mg2+ transporter-C (MgtC) family protein